MDIFLAHPGITLNNTFSKLAIIVFKAFPSGQAFE
jgi:hypothetical protein